MRAHGSFASKKLTVKHAFLKKRLHILRIIFAPLFSPCRLKVLLSLIHFLRDYPFLLEISM